MDVLRPLSHEWLLLLQRSFLLTLMGAAKAVHVRGLGVNRKLRRSSRHQSAKSAL